MIFIIIIISESPCRNVRGDFQKRFFFLERLPHKISQRAAYLQQLYPLLPRRYAINSTSRDYVQVIRVATLMLINALIPQLSSGTVKLSVIFIVPNPIGLVRLSRLGNPLVVISHSGAEEYVCRV